MCIAVLSLVTVLLLAGTTTPGQSPNVADIAVVGKNKRVTASVRRTINLNEEKAYLSDISDIAVAGEDAFYVTSADVGRLVVYDGGGRQKTIVGQWGEGPLEYARPHRILIARDSLILWDSTNLKYIIYDTEGVARREMSDSSAIADFVWTDRFLVTYRSGISEDFIEILNRRTQHHSATGAGSVTHLALMLLNGSGRFGIARDHVYYASPASPVIFSYDLITKRKRSVAIENSDFDVNDRRYTDRAEIQRDIGNGKIIKFLTQSSRVRGVWVLDEIIVAVVENGRYGRGIPLPDRRRLDLEIFDFDLRSIDTIPIGADRIERWGHLLPGSYRNRLYFVKEPDISETGAESPRTLLELVLTVDG